MTDLALGPGTDMERLFRLDGRTALITGGAQGIGRAIAALFAGAGAHVMIADRNRDTGTHLAHSLTAQGQRADFLAADLADPHALAALADTAEDVSGGIDILVCNAGISGAAGPMHLMADADRDALYAVNLDHPIRLSNRLAQAMAARGRGSIILMSSLAGLRGNGGIGHYGITKAALAQLARNLAVEWGPRGVRANALAPGLIATDWAQAILSNPERTERRLGLTPLRRIGMPEEVAAAALFLASDAAGFITGQTLVVDGGTLISDGN
jgi:NAD(P)-dependent dehydrogenase (short-subunit alcohol dehydrogenase family)